jgi:hypothetical protein
MKKALITEIISSLFVILFTYAALSKLLVYSVFEFQLRRSPFITQMAGFVAWIIPVSELLIVFILLFKKTRLIGLYFSFFLMVLFTSYIYGMLRYSYFVPCSCGGVLSRMSWNQHLIFNILFSVLALWGILMETYFRQKDIRLTVQQNRFI